MKVLRVTSVWAALFIVVGGCFELACGHMHVLFQPFEMIMAAGIYAIGFWPTGIYKANLRIRQRQNRICAMSFLGLSLSLGLLRTFGYLDESWITIGQHLAANLVALPLALFGYLAMEFSFQIEDKITLADAASALSLKEKRKPILQTLLSAAPVFSLSFLCVGLPALLPKPKPDPFYEGMRKFEQEAEVAYVKKNCAPFPSEDRWKAEQEYTKLSRKPANESHSQ